MFFISSSHFFVETYVLINDYIRDYVLWCLLWLHVTFISILTLSSGSRCYDLINTIIIIIFMWVLGNSGKPVTLKTSGLTKFSKYVFQEQGIRDYRKPGTCEVTNSRMCRIRESWFGEKAELRTCGSSESQLLMARASEDCRFGNLMKTLFGTQARGHARTCWEARATSGICWRPSSGISGEGIHEPQKKQSQSCSPKKSGFSVWTSGRLVNMLGGKRHSCVCSH
jgi:hypothetical protein